MTPGARVQAAIEVLDAVLAGVSAEKALIRWARHSRFAGSKDRAAVRDHVFDAIRRKRSAIAFGGAVTGRAVMLGLLRGMDIPPATLFTGIGHAPPALGSAEQDFLPAPLTRNEEWNLPDWLAEAFEQSLGTGADATARQLQHRAPVCLRVNQRRGSVDAARARLSSEGVKTEPHGASPVGLLVRDGARRVRQTSAFVEGLVELQDAHSQAVVQDLPPSKKVMDYCAGGGGKALAMADLFANEVHAHDADPERMKDIPGRAERAGVSVQRLATEDIASAGPYDLVSCDAPCSGSGSWRRSPEAKWTLTEERLSELCATQIAILCASAHYVAPGGTLAYVTCSVLTEENENAVGAFLREKPEWRCMIQKRYPVTEDADGFFLAQFKR